MHPFRTGLRRKLLTMAIANACATALFAAPAALAQGNNLQPNESSDTSTTLPTLQVTESRLYEEATGPVDGYVATHSATGTKTDTAIIETPQSISVVTADEVSTRGSSSLLGALNYTPGVLSFEGADRTGDGFVIRGFNTWATGTTFLNGMRYGAQVYDGRMEPYGMERVEVLKGGASILYGRAPAGGLVNAVSKRPSAEPIHEINLQAGSYDRRQVSGDFAGPLTEDGTVSYRLVALHRDSDTFIDHVPDDRTYLAPSIRWQPSEDTSLTLLADYQHDRTAYQYPFPAEGTTSDSATGRIPRSRFSGIPGHDTYDNERYSFSYIFDHAFSDNLQINHSSRYFSADKDFHSTWPLTGTAENWPRFAMHRYDTTRSFITDTSLSYDWSIGPASNISTAGLDFNRDRTKGQRFYHSASPINLITGESNNSIGYEYLPQGNFGTTYTEQTGLYFQNHTTVFDKWVFLLGGRQDWAESKNSTPNNPEWDSNKDDAFTARLGAAYLADNGLAPFIGLSQSFDPQRGTNRNGEHLSPSEGEQYEIGLRYQPPGSNAMISASAYQITQENVSVTDPVDPNFRAQLGEVRSRGMEVEGKIEVTPDTNLVLGYAYTDARTTKSSPLTPDQVGRRTGNVPYHQIQLWGDQRFSQFGFPGLKVGAGARYVGSRNGYSIDVDAPSYTLFDAMISYETGPWRYAINASNITDETYIESCTWGCVYGEPRTLLGSVTYQW